MKQSNFSYLLKYYVLILALMVTVPVLANTLNCPCEVTTVLAGDTVYMVDGGRSSRKIWLTGIDAPQLNQLYGEQSRLNLMRMVLRKPVILEDMQRDQFGRITARLIVEGQDINLQQIKDGYAWYYRQDGGLPDELKSAYAKAESDARNDTRGLWESRAIPPWEFREK